MRGLLIHLSPLGIKRPQQYFKHKKYKCYTNNTLYYMSLKKNLFECATNKKVFNSRAYHI